MTDESHGPDREPALPAERGDFLSRWSRLKTQARRGEAAGGRSAMDAEKGEAAAAAAAPPAVPDEPPQVPAIDSLDLASDYRPFFHPKIEENVRRAALKKLFSDPRFNVMDGLDVYIDDYSKADPLPAGMLEQLEQARKILAWSREDEAARAQAAREAAHGELPRAPETDLPAQLEPDPATLASAAGAARTPDAE